MVALRTTLLVKYYMNKNWNIEEKENNAAHLTIYLDYKKKRK